MNCNLLKLHTGTDKPRLPIDSMQKINYYKALQIAASQTPKKKNTTLERI